MELRPKATNVPAQKREGKGCRGGGKSKGKGSQKSVEFETRRTADPIRHESTTSVTLDQHGDAFLSFQSGHSIADMGCTKSVAGTRWLEGLEHRLAVLDRKKLTMNSMLDFVVSSARAT